MTCGDLWAFSPASAQQHYFLLIYSPHLLKLFIWQLHVSEWKATPYLWIILWHVHYYLFIFKLIKSACDNKVRWCFSYRCSLRKCTILFKLISNRPVNSLEGLVAVTTTSFQSAIFNMWCKYVWLYSAHLRREAVQQIFYITNLNVQTTYKCIIWSFLYL